MTWREPGIALGDAKEKAEAGLVLTPPLTGSVQLWDETKEKESTLTGCLQTTRSQRRKVGWLQSSTDWKF